MKRQKCRFGFVAVLLMAACGCVSSWYQISTSEDEKCLDATMQYYVSSFESQESGANDVFIKDDGSSPDGILYDEVKMPIKIVTHGSKELRNNDRPWTVLCLFSLGICPYVWSESIIQYVSIVTPLGAKTGSFRVDAEKRIGLIPFVFGCPSSDVVRAEDAKLPNREIERGAQNRLVDKLTREFSYDEYVRFAKRKNHERKIEINRLEAVSKQVDGLLSEKQFDAALELIEQASVWSDASQACDGRTLSDMRKRVAAAHQDHDKMKVRALTAAGKYEDAFSYCDAANTIPAEMKDELKKQAVSMAVKTLSETKDVDDLQVRRLAKFVMLWESSEIGSFVEAISCPSLRSKFALILLDDCKPSGTGYSERHSYEELAEKLASFVERPDLEKRARKIFEHCADRVHFEGFYVGMSVPEYAIMKAYHNGIGPRMYFERHEFCYYELEPGFICWRADRYKLFEKENGEFWAAFMRKYIPAGKKKSLGEEVSDFLDRSSYAYTQEWKFDEWCCVYTSLKYRTKVTYLEKSGILVFEKYE